MGELFLKKKRTYVTVEIDGKAYDCPKDMPIPRIGECISVDYSGFGKVTKIFYQIIGNFIYISIHTEPI